MTASDLVLDARALHESFGPEHHPTKVVLQALRRALARYYREAFQVAPHAVTSVVTFDRDAIDTAFNAESESAEAEALVIPAFQTVVEALGETADGALFPCQLVGTLGTGRFWKLPVRIQGRSAYLTLVAGGGDVRDWPDIASLHIRYVPEPPEVIGELTVIDLPSAGRDFVVGAIALTLAARREGKAPSAAAAGAQMCRDALATLATTAGSEDRWYVTPVEL